MPKGIHQHKRGEESNHWRGGKIVDKDGYIRILSPGHPRARGRYVLEHILIAERALGHSLLPGAIIHHVDGNMANNANSNLVICQDQAYHLLLHTRTRALRACGNANYRFCCYCKRWDDPQNMRIYTWGQSSTAKHQKCSNDHCRAYRLKIKEGGD